jgi:hypothetical protein
VGSIRRGKFKRKSWEVLGLNWDAYILLQSSPLKSEVVPNTLQETMDKAIVIFIRSPFDTAPIPADAVAPDDWMDQITQYARCLIPDEIWF